MQYRTETSILKLILIASKRLTQGLVNARKLEKLAYPPENPIKAYKNSDNLIICRKNVYNLDKDIFYDKHCILKGKINMKSVIFFVFKF